MYKRTKKVLRVLFIEANTDIRQQLIEYYHTNIRWRWIQAYDSDTIYEAENVSKAKIKLKRGIQINMIVFSQDFDEINTDKFRTWLNIQKLSIPFFILPSTKVA